MHGTLLFYSSLVFAAVAFSFGISEIYTYSNHVRRTVREGGAAAFAKKLGNEMRTDRGNSLLTVILLWSSISIGWLAYGATPRYLFFPGPAYMYVLAGAAIILTGIAVRRWSMAALGNMFTHLLSIQRNHRVVTEGPYKIVRHPSYLGGFLAVIGFGVAMGNLAGLLPCIIMPMIAYYIRIRKEEKMLSERLGQAYKKYSLSVRYRIIPHVW